MILKEFSRAWLSVNPQVPGSSPGRGAKEHKSPQTKVCGLFFLNSRRARKATVSHQVASISQKLAETPIKSYTFPTMKPSTALQTKRAAIRSVVERHNALNARVFGSVVHGDDHEGSDLDLLIDPTPKTSLMDVAKIQVELEAILGVKVDVLTPNALPDSFRHIVLAEAVPV